MPKILIADDEASLLEAVSLILKGQGYDVCVAEDGVRALLAYETEKPDLAILDVMMPRIDGIEICSALREISPGMPILMLTAKREIADKAAGFEAGADDYLTKPFNQTELLLRVEALLRRNSLLAKGPEAGGGETPAEVVEFDGLRIDLRKKEVQVDGVPVSLTPKEFALVSLLASVPGRTFSKDELVQGAWGPRYGSSDISIPTYVRHIREKIERNPAIPERLITVGRLGYRLGCDPK